MPRLAFFALQPDLAGMLAHLEDRFPLAYHLTGNFRVGEAAGPATFQTWTELPRLGEATAASAPASDSYLVLPRGQPAELRHLRGADGPRVLVDQLANEDSLVLRPAGRWGDRVVLAGELGTAHAGAWSAQVLAAARAYVRRYFVRVGSYAVGAEAHRCFRTGHRLTSAVQSPPSFDLAE